MPTPCSRTGPQLACSVNTGGNAWRARKGDIAAPVSRRQGVLSSVGTRAWFQIDREGDRFVTLKTLHESSHWFTCAGLTDIATWSVDRGTCVCVMRSPKQSSGALHAGRPDEIQQEGEG